MIYVTRAEWGARPPKYVNPISSPVEGIFVHYRGPGGAPSRIADEMAALRQDQAYHMDVKGWSDIAYSWAVGNSGTIYELRGWGVRGGHTQGWNDRSHAVLWIGGDAGIPSDAALDAINVVCLEARKRYGGFVKGHRDVNSTSCPGDALYAQIKAGRFDRPAPAPVPEEDDMPKPMQLLRDKDNHVWLCDRNTKVHVPSGEHVNLLIAVGQLGGDIIDNRGPDSTKLIETLGTLPNGRAV